MPAGSTTIDDRDDHRRPSTTIDDHRRPSTTIDDHRRPSTTATTPKDRTDNPSAPARLQLQKSLSLFSLPSLVVARSSGVNAYILVYVISKESCGGCRIRRDDRLDVSRDQISLERKLHPLGANMELSMLEHDYRQLALVSRKATASSGLASFIWSASSAKEGEDIKESAERVLLLLRGDSAIDAEALCVCLMGRCLSLDPLMWLDGRFRTSGVCASARPHSLALLVRLPSGSSRSSCRARASVQSW